MVKHIILWKLKETLTEEEKVQAKKDIKENLDYERMQEVVKCILRVAFELE